MCAKTLKKALNQIDSNTLSLKERVFHFVSHAKPFEARTHSFATLSLSVHTNTFSGKCILLLLTYVTDNITFHKSCISK